MGDSFTCGHYIQAIPETIDKVDIRMARWAKHDFGSLCASTGRMRREIRGAHVRFGLDDAADAPSNTVVMDQMDADELARDEEGVLAGVKGTRKLSGHVA
jgi:hypothetical protein